MVNEANELLTPSVPPETLGVAALMEQVQLVAPAGTVTVKGTVRDLRPWPSDNPKTVYGEIEDTAGDYTMSFRCPCGSAPSLVKEHTVLRGTLKIKRSRVSKGYDLTLIGDKIGNWVPDTSMEDIIGIPKIERTKLSFERFVATGPAKRIAFVGTERALRDAESTFKRSSQSTLSLVPSVANFQQFQATISNLVPSFDALCFLRGGGDPASFVIWNDSRLISYLVELRLPFYTALGHSTDFTLADKYADESFVTPSDLGAAYSNALQARNQREVMQRDLDQARNERNELQLQKDSLSNSFSEIHGLHSARSKRTTTLLLVLLILLAAAVAALVFR